MTLPYLADVTVRSATQHSRRSRQSALRNPRRRRSQRTLLAAVAAVGYLVRRALVGGSQ